MDRKLATELISKLENQFKDPQLMTEWNNDPLAVLEGFGLSFDTLDTDRRSTLKTRLSWPDWMPEPHLPTKQEILCKSCKVSTEGILHGMEYTFVAAVIVAIVLLIGGSEGADEAAGAAIIEMDEIGIVDAAGSLEQMEITGFDLAADIFDLPGEKLARCCLEAYKDLRLWMKAHKFVRFVGNTMNEVFIYKLTEHICKARKLCV